MEDFSAVHCIVIPLCKTNIKIFTRAVHRQVNPNTNRCKVLHLTITNLCEKWCCQQVTVEYKNFNFFFDVIVCMSLKHGVMRQDQQE